MRFFISVLLIALTIQMQGAWAQECQLPFDSGGSACDNDRKLGNGVCSASDYLCYIQRIPNLGNFTDFPDDCDGNAYLSWINGSPAGDHNSIAAADRYDIQHNELNTKPVSYDLAALLSKLQPGQTIVHEGVHDKKDPPAYTIEDDAHLDAFEKLKNEQGHWNFDENAAQKKLSADAKDWFARAFVAVYTTFKSAHTITIQALAEQNTITITQGTNYARVKALVDYAKSLPGDPSQEKLKLIYDKTQQTIVGNQNYQYFDMSQVLACGTGVCRHQASVLALALKSAGFDVGVVFSNDHSWTRLDLNGKSYDLDPNYYYTFRMNPARSLCKDYYQVLHFEDLTPRPKSADSFPFFSRTLSQELTTSGEDRSIVESVCSDLGVCLNATQEMWTQTNNPESFEFWQGNASDYWVVTLFKNSDLHFIIDSTNTMEISGQQVPVLERKQQVDSQEMFLLLSSIPLKDGQKILLQIVSNRSILENATLRNELAKNLSIIDAARPTPTPSPTSPPPSTNAPNQTEKPADLCPGDPLKDQPLTCGCNHPDIDSNGDGLVDCGTETSLTSQVQPRFGVIDVKNRRLTLTLEKFTGKGITYELKLKMVGTPKTTFLYSKKSNVIRTKKLPPGTYQATFRILMPKTSHSYLKSKVSNTVSIGVPE